MSGWIIARDRRGLLAAVNADGFDRTDSSARKRKRPPYAPAMRRSRPVAVTPRAGRAGPVPYHSATGSMDASVTIVGGGLVGAKSPRMPARLLVPGQQTPSVGGLSFVLCSKGSDETMHQFRRPQLNDPLVLLSFDAYCGRTDHRDTRAFELYQSNREVAARAIASYHGCAHFQQPDQARILPTDTLITRIAGTVRRSHEAVVRLNHPRCTRDVTFRIGIRQRADATWLLPLRECNAHQHHTVVLKVVDDVAECLECGYVSTEAELANDPAICPNCTAGRYAHLRVAVGDTITVEGHTEVAADPDSAVAGLSRVAETAVTYEAAPLGASNRHARDISP